jgi:hypothetical protein
MPNKTQYFAINFLKHNRIFCFVSPKLTCGGKLLVGEPARPVMEQDDVEVLDLQMVEDRGGLKLPDFVGNTSLMLALSKPCAEALAQLDLGEHEVLPARLINKKKRVHSDGYVVVNPLGHIDCLDLKKSDVINDPDEDPYVRPLGKYFLVRSNIPEKIDLFRASGVGGFICSERFVQTVEKHKFTNFAFTPVQLS